MTPQLIYLAVVLFALGVSCANHGKPREPENFWMVLLSVAIALSLQYWGGFYAPLGLHP